MKTFCTLITLLAVCLIRPGQADAEAFVGSLGVVVDPFVTSTSSFTGSSLKLNQTNLVTTAETGTFLTLVPALGDLTAFTGTVSGLTTFSSPHVIPNFFVFSTPYPLLNSSGTTPLNRFAFDLSSLSESSYTGTTASFWGQGTLTDSLGAITATPAEFNLAFSSKNGYSFTLEAASVPEPSTWAFLTGSLLFLVFVLRFKRQFKP